MTSSISYINNLCWHNEYYSTFTSKTVISQLKIVEEPKSSDADIKRLCHIDVLRQMPFYQGHVDKP